MTSFLAIDTSTSACSVALNIQGNIKEEFIDAPQDHTQRLLPMIRRLLVESDIKLSQLDAIAFSSGPGSFTGLRICTGVVQGLAYGADLPVIGVSTLEVMAATALRLIDFSQKSTENTITSASKTVELVIVPALDARMSEIYWGAFQQTISSTQSIDTIKHSLKRLHADTASSPENLQIKEIGESEILNTKNMISCGVGHGWQVEGIDIDGFDKIDTKLLPHAYDLAALAEKYFNLGEMKNAFDAQPTYIRNEVSWAKRKRIRI